MTQPSTTPTSDSKRLRLAARLDREHGVDASRVAYVDDEGWSVREVQTLADQHREGALLRNCLYQETDARANVWSLRDPDNIPRITFAAWRLECADDGEVGAGLDVCTLVAGDALVSTHLELSTFDGAEVQRLADCAAACAEQFVPMPDEFEWLRQMAAVHGVTLRPVW